MQSTNTWLYHHIYVCIIFNFQFVHPHISKFPWKYFSSTMTQFASLIFWTEGTSGGRRERWNSGITDTNDHEKSFKIQFPVFHANKIKQQCSEKPQSLGIQISDFNSASGLQSRKHYWSLGYDLYLRIRADVNWGIHTPPELINTSHDWCWTAKLLFTSELL